MRRRGIDPGPGHLDDVHTTNNNALPRVARAFLHNMANAKEKSDIDRSYGTVWKRLLLLLAECKCISCIYHHPQRPSPTDAPDGHASRADPRNVPGTTLYVVYQYLRTNFVD